MTSEETPTDASRFTVWLKEKEDLHAMYAKSCGDVSLREPHLLLSNAFRQVGAALRREEESFPEAVHKGLHDYLVEKLTQEREVATAELARIAAEEVTFREGHNQRLKDAWEERDMALAENGRMREALGKLTIGTLHCICGNASHVHTNHAEYCTCKIAVEALAALGVEVVLREDAEALAEALDTVLRSACPRTEENPTMCRAWLAGREVLASFESKHPATQEVGRES